MDTISIIEVIAHIATAAGLFFTASAFFQNEKARQLQITESIFKDLRELENRFYEKYINENDEKKKQWGSIFFNTIEWFSFLINRKKLKDKEMISFFDNAVISFYESLFCNIYEDNVIKDPLRFPEFKKLYHKLKEENSN